MPKVWAADVAWSKSPPGIHDFRVVAMPHHKCVVVRHVDWSAVQGLPVKVTCHIPVMLASSSRSSFTVAADSRIVCPGWTNQLL
jgi:hypothetical protein